jgi:hypothetical protein
MPASYRLSPLDLTSTNRMPVSAARSSIGGRPPFGRNGRGGGREASKDQRAPETRGAALRPQVGNACRRSCSRTGSVRRLRSPARGRRCPARAPARWAPRSPPWTRPPARTRPRRPPARSGCPLNKPLQTVNKARSRLDESKALAGFRGGDVLVTGPGQRRGRRAGLCRVGARCERTGRSRGRAAASLGRGRDAAAARSAAATRSPRAC